MRFTSVFSEVMGDRAGEGRLGRRGLEVNGGRRGNAKVYGAPMGCEVSRRQFH